ncbi:GmrSD restriction endonuclease domain-containing protein [Prescottella agglutinans]|uniref:Pyruvate/2-oxoglutarate dehydrogenase complex dihydrolipoamide acyltransferase (E2) component n=1 Tax=Prescottella agglutinans TaxID=1644129 RepID=A0ABT6MIH2_9NOCA|nr:DUF1524 domain-containing protein [Prescottella agglutinans]MDH6284118.1 pyruvate/2-oxoglutarate dehydrogenase complex dihydrolipoamide acyltransferase (E2) component [Prescottella agglutinans]
MSARPARPHQSPVRARSALIAITISAAALALAGCEGGDAAAQPTTTTTAASTSTSVAAAQSSTTTAATSAAAAASGTDATTGQALAQLETLPVKGRAPKTGYSRDAFGQAWTDNVTVDGGHNGCDTRNDILRRDLVDITLKPGSNNCTVLTGTLHDTYTSQTIAFTRGEGTSTAVQIDHVVALSDAWQKGAQQLDEPTRRNLANDPLNLIAVDGPANMAKGDGDAATWLPPSKAYRCTYVTKQVQVKAKYNLWVTQAEKDAIAQILGSCGENGAAAPAPVNGGQASPAALAPSPAPAPQTQAQAPAPAPVVAPEPAPSSGASFGSCKEARAAGAAPLRRGEPGYSSKLDRDGDGVACE